MVLDESALEAMIARQRAAEGGHQSVEAVRTEQTDEFEVYERPDAPPEKPGLSAPPPRPMAPPQADPANDFEELPGRAPTEAHIPPAFQVDPQPQAPVTPSPAPMPQPEPQAPPQPAEPAPVAAPAEPVVEPTAQPVMPAPVTPAPQPPVTPEPSIPAPVAPTPEPPVAEPQPPAPAPVEPMPEAEVPKRRPQVWPPLSMNTEAEPPAEPETPAEPVATPSPATPEPREPAEVPSQKTLRTHAPTPHAFPSTGVNGSGCRIAVVQAMFNQELTDQMATQAKAHAEEAGATVTHHITVPGVYDLPLAVQSLARRKDVDAVAVIGVVVQGETKHDELITFSTAKSLQEISLATETPVGLGIIGPGMTWDQAVARVGNGVHAVEAAIAQWQALASL